MKRKQERICSQHDEKRIESRALPKLDMTLSPVHSFPAQSQFAAHHQKPTYTRAQTAP